MEALEPEQLPRRTGLAGLAKCSLLISFLLALAVWWCVPDADSAVLVPKQAGPSPTLKVQRMIDHPTGHVHGPPSHVHEHGPTGHMNEHGPPGRARRRFPLNRTGRTKDDRRTNEERPKDEGRTKDELRVMKDK